MEFSAQHASVIMSESDCGMCVTALTRLCELIREDGTCWICTRSEKNYRRKTLSTAAAKVFYYNCNFLCVKYTEGEDYNNFP